MNARVKRVGGQARKHLGGRSCAFGTKIAWRSRLLASAGVRTPVGVYEPATHELVFPWIPGTSGRDLAQQCFSAPQANNGSGGVVTELLHAVLAPLARLHRVDARPLELAPLNAWRRIHPRLVVGSSRDTTFAYARRVHDQLKEIGTRLFADLEPVPVHADYHVGQLLFEASATEPWLLDMDDLALGPREHDLGSFSAHLATSGLRDDDVQDMFWDFECLVRTSYEDIAGVRVDARLARYYGAISLLRRALKLREGGAGELETARILCAASSVVEDIGGRARGIYPESAVAAR